MTTKCSRFARLKFLPVISYNDCARQTIMLGMWAAVIGGKGWSTKGFLDWGLIYFMYSYTFSMAASSLVELIRFCTILESTLLIIFRNLKSCDAICPYYKYANTLIVVCCKDLYNNFEIKRKDLLDQINLCKCIKKIEVLQFFYFILGLL
jgi:hypothetical protein